MLHSRPTAPALAVALTLWLGAAAPAAASELAACLDASDLLRVARVLDPTGRPVYARVTAQSDGHITRAATIAPDGTPLAEVFARGRAAAGPDFPVSDDRVCAAVDLPEARSARSRRRARGAHGMRGPWHR
jgi:hypothetical protein